jgi:hypothetical protein
MFLVWTFCGVAAAVTVLVPAGLAQAPADWLARVADDKPLASAAENKDEYNAFNALVLQARKQSPEALAQNARPGVTGRELTGEERKNYRGQVVHVVGRLIKLEAIDSNGLLAAEGVKKLYQAWIRDDTTPEFLFCVLTSELPSDVKPAEKIDNVWVALDGYFLKRLKYREANADHLAPVVIARSLRRSDASTDPPAKTPLELGDPRLDCPRDWLEHIEDDVPVQSVQSSPDEYNAYNYFVLHARKVPPEMLAKNARRELTFRVLFQKDRGKYRGEIVHVEGKLLYLKWIGSNSALEAAGVKDLWEAWIFEDGADDNPTCVLLTELPEGIKPADRIHDTRASVDGYFFKRLKYEAHDATRLAPLVIGRTLTARAAPPPTGPASEYESLLGDLLPVGIVSVVSLTVILVALSWWFRRGDKHVRTKLGEIRSQALFRDEPPQGD